MMHWRLVGRACLAVLIAAPVWVTVATAQTPAVDIATGSFEAHADRFSSPSVDEVLMEGNVTFRSGDVLLQADSVLYNRVTRSGEAVGNVLYVQSKSRIAGDTVTFNFDDNTARITNATGYLDDQFLFRARLVEQLDSKRMRFEKGLFTACTQPVPYWSFRVSSGLIVKDRYVHLHNLSLRAGNVPVFWTPYLLFPIKPERATGLLMPQLGFSNRLGTSIGNAFYWAVGRTQDATFFMDLYDEGSVGGGAEYRFVPNSTGAGQFEGYFIDEDSIDDDESPNRQRWNLRYRQRQNFSRGARLLTSLEFVSDGEYFLDFSRDLDRGSDPAALSRAELVLNRGYSSWNFRLERREQFFSTADVIQSRLPEVELRTRSRRLGKSPFFLGFEGSGSVLDRSAPGFPSSPYGRVDLFPTLSAPFSQLPYLDITPTLKLRETFYTRSLDLSQPALDPIDPAFDPEGVAFGSGVSREFLQFETQILGPRLSRIFVDEDGTGKFKSTIEPQLAYRYQTTPSTDDALLVPRFDEIDVLPADVNEVRYALVSRLLARRKVSATPRTQARQDPNWLGDFSAGTRLETPTWGPPGSDPAAELPDGTDKATDEEAAPEEEDILSSPVEIASFSISQRFSFDDVLSLDTELGPDTNGDGILDTRVVDDSSFSPIVMGGRYNPSMGSSIDVSVSYDVLENTVSSTSLSASLFNARSGFLNGTWFFRNGLDGRTVNASTLRVAGGTSFLEDRISMAIAVNYDATLEEFLDQRYRFGYDTQCCGFALEFRKREFIGTAQNEFRFVINLRGLGNFLDLQGR